MTKQEEIAQLRKHPKHYLWDIPRSLWTQQDLINLMNPDQEPVNPQKRQYNKQEELVSDVKPKAPFIKPRKSKKPYSSKVIFTKDGKSTTYASIAEASRLTEIPLGDIYAFANNQRKPTDSSSWVKVLNTELINS